jgi:hydrogenase maturation protease
MNDTILVACVGNIFLGDDGFGVEVARALTTRSLPEGVVAKDFGIRGFDLAYALLEPWRTVILVDALPRGGRPGAVYVMEPDLSQMGNPSTPGMELNPHGMDPVRVLNLALSMGPVPAKIFVVGCEPGDFGDESGGRMGLSATVRNGVSEACNMVQELAIRILARDARARVHLHDEEANRGWHAKEVVQ